MKTDSAVAKTPEGLALDMLVAVGDLTRNRVTESIRLADAALSCLPAQSLVRPRFEVVDNSLVIDHCLQLMWAMDESEEEMDHDAREKYAADCRLGGFTNWRQGVRWELLSIADSTKYDPCVDPAIFHSNGGWVGTSEVCAWSPGRVFIVDFSDGYVYHHDRNGKAFCRPVRSLVSGQ